MSDVTANVLRFDELLPERDYFELKEGKMIPFLSAAEMDAVHVARLANLEKRFKVCRERLDDDGSDEAAATEFDETASSFVHFILPDIPDDLIASLHLGQKTMILNWWTEQNRPKGRVEGEAEA